MALSANIRMFRKKAGLTQIELAEKMGISIATLRRWEAGETAPTGTRIMELAERLGTSPDMIVSSQSNNTESQDQSQNHYENNNANRGTVNGNGMLVFEGGGTRIELPPTDRGYELFNKLVDNLINNNQHT